MKYLRWIWNYFFPAKPTWADGVRYVNPRHAVLYAEVVAWIISIGHAVDIQQPEMRVTVRVWPGALPPPHAQSWACVLAPNEIFGDMSGTMCFRNSVKDDENELCHEMKHAITGIGGEVPWLFPQG